MFYVTAGIALLFPGAVWAQQENTGPSEKRAVAVPAHQDLNLGQQSAKKQAKAKPRSILFPSGEPGPYIPARRAESQDVPLSQGGGDQNETGLGDPGGAPSTGPVIETLELNVMAPAAMGLMTEEEGGLPLNLWQGSSQTQITRLLQGLVVTSRSPTLSRLTEKLLLSAALLPGQEESSPRVDLLPRAAAPEQEGQESYGGGNTDTPLQGQEAAGPENSSSSGDTAFLNLRLRKISEMGHLGHLVSFLKILPPDSYQGSKELSDIMLLAGDLSAACQMARFKLARSEEPRSEITPFEPEQATADHYWLKVLVYCQAMEGRADNAELTIEQLMELGNTEFIFFDLINKISAERDAVAGEAGISSTPALSSGLNYLDPLMYSVLSVLEQPIDAQLFTDAPALVLFALAENAQVSQEGRFMAAATSYGAGTYPSSKLIAHYNGVRFSEDEYENALSIAKEDEGALGDVLLYQAAAKQIDPRVKAEMLREIWDRALLSRDLARAAHLNARTVNSIQPAAELIFHASHLTRALLLAGNVAKAQEWFDYTRNAAYAGDNDATQALMDIWPMIILAGQKDELPWSREILDLWWNGQMVLSPDQRGEKAGLFYSVAEALGYVVPEPLWQELTGSARSRDQRSIPVAVWRNLVKAVAEKKNGETLLLSLIAAGGKDGPAGLDPTGASAVLRALRSMGFEAEARDLAIEILANNGF